MNGSTPRLSELTRNHVASAGAAGRAWLDELPRVVAELSRRWNLVPEEEIDGGSASYVRRVRTSDGAPAVLKVAFADDLRQQAAVLEAADGRGYARLLAFDERRQAMLLTRLGGQLRRSGMPPRKQLAVLAGLLGTAWAAVPLEVAPAVAPGDDKASSLGTLITEIGDLHPGLCPPRVRARALKAAADLAAVFDPTACVVVHGDPHPENALSVPDAPGTYAFVDPDGFRCDPAYDLGVTLRDWSRDLLAAGPSSARRWLTTACEATASATGLEADRVWEWAFLERVSTGLYVAHLGSPAVGRPFLESAALLL